MITVFDRKQIARQRARAAAHLPDYGFLADWAMREMTSRLDVVARAFPRCLQIGCRTAITEPLPNGIEAVVTCDNTPALSPDVVCEEDYFPFASHSFDLILSPMNLHTVNDLPGALIQIRRALKPDGLFAAALLGGETLHELRQCLMEAELEITGGISPRVAPFADKQQMGALLQRAGFALPVVDSDIVKVSYQSMFHLMRDLRLMGEGNAVAERRRTVPPRALFPRAADIYAARHAEDDGRVTATFEVIFLHGWAPHESQQKPQRRGSATGRLAHILGTEEIGTGEKT